MKIFTTSSFLPLSFIDRRAAEDHLSYLRRKTSFTLIELLVAPACFRSESEKSIKV